jgi:hypothetical protein
LFLLNWAGASGRLYIRRYPEGKPRSTITALEGSIFGADGATHRVHVFLVGIAL